MKLQLRKYKQANFNINKIKIAAREALMACDSQYCHWNAEQQEKFRASLYYKDNQRILQILLYSLLGIKCSLKNVYDVWSENTLKKPNILNLAIQLVYGIGDNFITIHQMSGDNDNLLAFPNLYDYDYANYLYQSAGMDYDYYPFNDGYWFSLVVENQYYNASGISLAGHIFYDKLEDFSDTLIEQLIPHSIESDFDADDLNIQIDANGLEKQLNELKDCRTSYLNNRKATLIQYFSQSKPAVYVLFEPAKYFNSKKWEDAPHILFIFSNEQTIKQVSWTSFLSDIEPLISDSSFVTQEIIKEVDMLEYFIRKNHQIIMENFDPKLNKK